MFQYKKCCIFVYTRNCKEYILANLILSACNLYTISCFVDVNYKGSNKKWAKVRSAHNESKENKYFLPFTKIITISRIQLKIFANKTVV